MSNTRHPEKTFTSLREALEAKKIRLEHYDIPLVDSETAAEAAAVFKQAKAEHEATAWSTDDDLKERTQQRLAETRAALSACFHRISFRGLTEPDFDALMNEHPPTDDQKAEGEIVNAATFDAALLAACYVGEDGLTAQEWTAELANKDRWTGADKRELLATVRLANQRDFNDGIPKD